MVDPSDVQRNRARSELNRLHDDLVVHYEPLQQGSAAAERPSVAGETHIDITLAVQLVTDTLAALEELRMQNNRKSEELVQAAAENRGLNGVVDDLRVKLSESEKENSILRAKNQESERANQQGLVERRKLVEQNNVAEEKLKTIVGAIVSSFQGKPEKKLSVAKPFEVVP